jgi:hypothetical protein
MARISIIQYYYVSKTSIVVMARLSHVRVKSMIAFVVATMFPRPMDRPHYGILRRRHNSKMVYCIGDESSSSNYRPGYCNKCDADTIDHCICRDQQQIDGICKECGQNHSYRPNFSGVQTSIDVIFSEQFNERQSSTARAVKVAIATKEQMR